MFRQRRFSHNRASTLVLFLVLAVFFSVSCSPLEDRAVRVDVSGGLVLTSGKGEVRVRSYAPSMLLNIHRDAGTDGEAVITVENIPAGWLRAKVVSPSGETEKATLFTEALSPAELKLSLKGGSGPQSVELFWEEEFLPAPLTFAVLGDNQGNNDVLAKMIEEINQSDASFLVHLGDMVPSGEKKEYEDFLETMSALEIPFYSVPGNHDVRGNGLESYEKLIAPRCYSFDLLGYRYLFLDTSLLGMGSAQMEWLQEQLQEEKNTLLFMHVPLTDPRGRGHAFLDRKEAHYLLDLLTATSEVDSGEVSSLSAQAGGVKGVFSGHIHMFHQEDVEGISFVISGGGGAPLYAAPEEGGFHHYALVSLSEEGVKVVSHPVKPPERSTGIVVTGRVDDLEISARQLGEMASLEREGQFQNVHGNFRGQGRYKGVPIRDLLELAGGMEQNDILIVHSWDGYKQEFAYENVYPEEAGWYEYQGDMVLGITYDGMRIPDWTEGYRIIFLPDDGVFDNEDLIKTSAPGQGSDLYLSAGSRWIKMVNRLEVVPWQER